MGVSRRLAAGTVASAQPENGGVYLPAERQEKKCRWHIRPWNTSTPELYCGLQTPLGYSVRSGKSSHQIPMSRSTLQVAPPAPDSIPFPDAHMTAVSVTATQGDWGVPQEHFTCSLSSVTFHIHYFHGLASNISVSLNYYSLIKTFCTFQPYFLLFQQQHLKLTSALLKARLKLAANESIFQKCDLCRGERFFPVVPAST